MSNLFAIIYDLPPGTVIHLKDDYPDECHEVTGYEWYASGGYIVFTDGLKLNMKNLELIADTLKKGAVPDGNVNGRDYS